MSLNRSLLQLIECPVCLKSMHSPIYICVQGHSICSDCSDTMEECPLCLRYLTDTRNFTLESISEQLEFPCNNEDAGCSEFVRLKDMDEHLKQCIYRQYNCRHRNCPWKGGRSDFVTHYKSVHRLHFVSLLRSKTKTLIWKDGISPIHETYLINLNKDVLFFLHRKLVGKTMYFALQYIGKPEDVIQFYFKLRIFTNEYKNREIIISEICNDDVSEDIDEVLENGNSISLPLNFFATFADADGIVGFSVQVLEA